MAHRSSRPADTPSVRLSALGWLLSVHHSYWRASSGAPMVWKWRTRSRMKAFLRRYSTEPTSSGGAPSPSLVRRRRNTWSLIAKRQTRPATHSLISP